MFVRWQSRGKSNSDYSGDSWSAILVESKRINGKPQQRHVAYLGGISAEKLKVDAQRCYFWDKVTERLNKLGEQIAADRSKIEAAISIKVPRPTDAEYKAAARGVAALLGWQWTSAGFKEALKDEAEQWQGRPSSLGRAFGGEAAVPPCFNCSKPVIGRPAGFLINDKPGYFCDECLCAAVKLLVEKNVVDQNGPTGAHPIHHGEPNVVDPKAYRAPTSIHHNDPNNGLDIPPHLDRREVAR
jgi:hypothetical protein